MSIGKIFGKSNVATGIVQKFDRRNKFSFRRIASPAGEDIYRIENLARSESLDVPRYIFDRLRSEVKLLREKIHLKGNAVFRVGVSFKTKDLYELSLSRSENENRISILSVGQNFGAGRELTFDEAALDNLIEILYSKEIEHPTDVLDRIVEYHKLFQFSFAEGGESITSDLAIQRESLFSVENYVPALGSKLVSKDDLPESDLSKTDQDRDTGQNAGQYDNFRSRLAERKDTGGYNVDFDELFGHGVPPVPKAHKSSSKKSRQESAKSYFSLPLLSADVKLFSKIPFKCEFSKEEIVDFRNIFLKDRESEYFLGFEILSVIFKNQSGRLKAFKFPLYYLKVQIQESGRVVLIEPTNGRKMYLNHVAIVRLFSQLSVSTATQDKLDAYLKSIQAQVVDSDESSTRVNLVRNLPISDSIFQKTREIFLGFAGEQGKGGLLGNLKIKGVEADLDSVYLYKVPVKQSPIQEALETDLDAIVSKAYKNPQEFHNSLLGDFLLPEVDVRSMRTRKMLVPEPWIPGALPPSTKRLLDKLNNNDLVLLEGPPGTGKTFTIMNLFIHCLATGKRLLVVSDQEAALHALQEKLEEYLVGDDRETPQNKNILELFHNAIKIADKVPSPTTQLESWAVAVKEMLSLASDLKWDSYFNEVELRDELAHIDQNIKAHVTKIEKIFATRKELYRLSKKTDLRHHYPSTEKNIGSLTSFLDFLKVFESAKTGESAHDAAKFATRFVKDRMEMLAGEFSICYDYFKFDSTNMRDKFQASLHADRVISKIAKQKPRTPEKLGQILHGLDPLLGGVIEKLWKSYFSADQGTVGHYGQVVASVFSYPIIEPLEKLQSYVSNFGRLLSVLVEQEKVVKDKFAAMHDELKSKNEHGDSFELFLLKNYAGMGAKVNSQTEIQARLEKIASLYKRRDEVIYKTVVGRLGEIVNSAYGGNEQGKTNKVTSVLSALDSLKNYKSIKEGAAFWRDFQRNVLDAFPIWLCRKQSVPFLFPLLENSFDLIIVDEATQCRVDDALPLLYRADKLMVVGDEKQTVLARNSVLDDYLFSEFELEEHLRHTQASGMKGGGSHIFGLVKGIKQASVMLDEHYRCPPDIIQFSNHYVYEDKLRTMQWQRKGDVPSVVVDYSEKKKPSSKKPSSGKYKAIEIDMIDRFFTYMEKTIKEIEKEEGRKINIETEVAICYFLLKNEPYVKDAKVDFLRRMNRGKDILDGAGAALQGKERNYIFYLWDVNRGNMLSFRQGDDETKRKGELNVLMSRPKKRAYHFLHGKFHDLDHRKANITDYLWNAYNKKDPQSDDESFEARKQEPGPEFKPWKRTSGQLFLSILNKHLVKKDSLGRGRKVLGNDAQFHVAVGNPRYCVDLMIPESKTKIKKNIAVLDLEAFEQSETPAQDIVDYYFQLKRATPKIEPVVLFSETLLNPSSHSLKRLKKVVMRIEDDD